MENKKLRIAIVCDPITDLVAGSIISTLRLAKSLRDRGHHIFFIASRSPKHPQTDEIDGINVYRFFSILFPKSEGQYYISFPTTPRLVSIFSQERADLVYIILPTPSGFKAMKAAQALGLKTVIHSHTQPENILMTLPNWLPQRDISRWMYGFLNRWYAKASAIVYPSLFASKKFKELNTKVTHEVISNGVDISQYRKVDSTSFKKKFSIANDEKIILFVGRLHAEKGVATLLRSLPFILKDEPKVRCMIVGFGHQEKELQTIVDTLSIKDRVTFTGRLENHGLVEAYSACSLFCLPSLAELEGMVVLEAMACGAPILIANAPESASVDFVQGNGLLHTPNDPEDLAKQALTILRNPALQQSMGAKSVELCESYAYEKSVEKLEHLFYSVL